MDDQGASVISAEQAAYVEALLAIFEANPENRDRAIARCLWYLERMDRIATMLEASLPQLASVAATFNGGLMGKVMGRGR